MQLSCELLQITYMVHVLNNQLLWRHSEDASDQWAGHACHLEGRVTGLFFKYDIYGSLFALFDVFV